MTKASQARLKKAGNRGGRDEYVDFDGGLMEMPSLSAPLRREQYIEILKV
jgi:hypothetical protein